MENMEQEGLNGVIKMGWWAIGETMERNNYY